MPEQLQEHEPTLDELNRMAYLLKLVPEGEPVIWQWQRILKDQFNAAMTVRIGAGAPPNEEKTSKKAEFIVYYRAKHAGYFLHGEGDEPGGYGGTSKIAEAAKFKTAKAARTMGEAYLRMSRADPERSEIVVLRQA